jgi:hypothetical protein
MTERDPDPNNALAPYYPSEVPEIPGNGRRWFAVLMALLLFSGAIYAFLLSFVPM